MVFGRGRLRSDQVRSSRSPEIFRSSDGGMSPIAVAVYARLIDDIRNDTTRLPQFFETAGRVIDIDQKRQKSLAYSLRRIRENIHVVNIVRTSLSNRVVSYRFALEHLVIMTPQVQAVEAERLFNQLQVQFARYDTLPPTWVREPSLASTR